MASGSNSGAHGGNAVLSSLSKHLQRLRKQHNIILRKHHSAQKKARKLRCSKDSVVAKISMLEELLGEFSSESTGPVDIAPASVTPSQETESVGLLEAHFPTSVEDPGNYTDPFFLVDWGENPRGYHLYRTICSLHCCKGTSHATYCLSLKGDATLSHSPSNTIGKLNKPKFWPIVEKIKGQLHVIDSYPSQFDDDPNCDWVFTHEVLKRDSQRCSWIEIPTPNEEIYIRSHAVVGDRLYAVGAGKFVVFDSTTEEWEARPAVEWVHPLSAKRVWHILQLGIARCVGEFPFKETDRRLYVLIAVLRDALNDDFGTFAVAYLVTSTGRVVCVQCLPRFFEKPVEPWCMSEGRMIDVDEEGKTLCCIVNGSALLNGKRPDFEWCDYLFINTFAVEMRTEAAPKVRQVWAQGSKAWLVELDFVRVDIEDKDRYVYKTDAQLEGEGDLPGFPGLQACFL